MEQPTKEEIDDMIATINRDGLEGLTRQEVRELCDAYLALREEVGEIMDRRMELISMCEQLQAENQALRARVEILDNMPSSGTGGQP